MEKPERTRIRAATVATIAEIPLPVLGEWSMLELITPEGAMKRVAAAHRDPTRVEPARLVSRVTAVHTDLPPVATGARIAHEGEPQRVTDAMLKMVKLDIAALEQACRT